jgi:O-methyltransferase involved in polyketide biosynthesis
MSDEGGLRNISDTAHWVAIYRALESERPDALFRDPFARQEFIGCSANPTGFIASVTQRTRAHRASRILSHSDTQWI